jgi:GH24 family phage-related lysozyme (muramidase)
VNAQHYADALATAIRNIAPNRRLQEADVTVINALADSFARRDAPAPVQCVSAPTRRTLGEIVSHEAIVLEWYKDSEGVGTWGVGVTNASGHNVDRYKDKPQTIRKCLEVYFWLLTQKYLPDVLAAFDGHPLTEAQLTAALSFHYNTGAIKRTDWVKLFRDGKPAGARDFLETHYLNDGDLKERRLKEAALFFDSKWSGNGTALVIPVSKPSYQPAFKRAQRVDITADLEAIAGALA